MLMSSITKRYHVGLIKLYVHILFVMIKNLFKIFKKIFTLAKTPNYGL